MKYAFLIFILFPLLANAQPKATLRQTLSRLPSPRARIDLIDQTLSQRVVSTENKGEEIDVLLEQRWNECPGDRSRCANFEKLVRGLCMPSLSAIGWRVWKGLIDRLVSAEQATGLKKAFDACSEFANSQEFAKVDMLLQARTSNEWPDSAKPMFASFEKTYSSGKDGLSRLLNVIQTAGPEVQAMRPVPLRYLRELALFSVRLAEKENPRALPADLLRNWLNFISQIFFATGDLDRFVKAMDLTPFDSLAEKNWSWAVAPIRLKCTFDRSVGKSKDCLARVSSYLSKFKDQLGTADRIELESELAKARLESGAAAEAAAQLDDLSKKADAANLRFTSLWLAYHDARAFLMLNKTAEAARSLEIFLGGSQVFKPLGPWIPVSGTVLQMRILIDQGKWDEALAAGEKAANGLRASVRGVPEVLVWLDLQTALIHAVRGNAAKFAAVKKTLDSEIRQAGDAETLTKYASIVAARTGGTAPAGVENFDLVWMKRALARNSKK